MSAGLASIKSLSFDWLPTARRRGLFGATISEGRVSLNAELGSSSERCRFLEPGNLEPSSIVGNKKGNGNEMFEGEEMH